MNNFLVMNEEEFDAFTNSLDRDLDKEIKRQELFLKTLEFELMELCFKCYPEFVGLKNKISKPLKQEAHECALMMTELMDYLVCGKPEDEGENAEQYIIPDRNESEEDEFERRENDFKFSCYEKVKEMVTKFFPELADLSGNAIRNINFSAYCSVLNFVDGFIFLVSNNE